MLDIELLDNGQCEVHATCPFCGKKHSFKTNYEQFMNSYSVYQGGQLLQKAFSQLNDSQREAIHTGLCNDCWEACS
jgi:hypothetical protein